MKTYKFDAQLLIPAPRAEVFEFFANPRNLERITPPWLHFDMVTPPDVIIEAGTLLDYRLRLHGIPLRWQSEISVWEPPYRFVDRQTQGPYFLWVHEHTFAEHNHSTAVADHIEYAVPGGSLVQKLFVAPDLQQIFAFRHQKLEQFFGSNPRTAAQIKTGT